MISQHKLNCLVHTITCFQCHEDFENKNKQHVQIDDEIFIP